MSKEKSKIICKECESFYTIVFDLGETSGFPKFCSICGEELFFEEYSDENDYYAEE